MAQSLVVSGLVAKHRELAGLIEHHRKEIERLDADLAHLCAALKLFAPGLDMRTLRPKEHRRRNDYFRPKERPRFILDTLRQAREPMSARSLAQFAVGSMGLEGGEKTVEAIQKSLQSALKTLKERGAVVEGPRIGLSRSWTLA
ncbi:MAG: hypothetical protein HGA21_16385 [Burkholderiaceae bacterium]|jgi:hypothetical protein|nr:hypothetical protein [Burkholderiaceae bacterium]